MDKRELRIDYFIWRGSFPSGYENLCRKAIQASGKAYSVYSEFSVGAAVLLANGEMVSGNNQENVAYPSGTCAERSACFYAHARYPQAKFRRIAVAARGTDGEFVADPVAPCGACRQSLLEYEMLAGGPVEVLLCGKDKVYRLPSVVSMLPLAFTDF